MHERRARAGVIRKASVNSPLAHLRFLHSGGSGSITIGTKGGPQNAFKQYSDSFEKLAEVIPAYGGETDTYVSQNRFYGSRKVSRLAELCTIFTDLDYYKVPDLKEMHPVGVLDLALETLERARIPSPALAIDTGRGLALLWRHEPVPRGARTRWQACQDHIFKALSHLGADPNAKNPATVLRLVGTYNSKSGTLVQVIWEDLEDEAWTFDDLANEILPYTREEMQELRAKRIAERDLKAARKDIERPVKSRASSGRKLTPASLNRDRLRDLYHLMKLREQTKLPPGKRNAWMFITAISLSGLVEPEVLEKKLIQLGRDKAGWSEAETRSRMHSVLDRAQRAVARNEGKEEKVKRNGQERDVRYWLKNQTIIEKLAITPEEEKEMKVIISAETKRERDRKRKEQNRRSQGAKPRGEYIADARERRQHHRHRAWEMRSQGMSLRKIAEALSISHTQVRQLLALSGEKNS